MKKLFLVATIGVAGLMSAKGTLKTDSQSSTSFTKDVAVLKSLQKKQHLVFETSCGNFVCDTDNNYSDSELINIFVSIEDQFCNNTVDPNDVVVTP